MYSFDITLHEEQPTGAEAVPPEQEEACWRHPTWHETKHAEHCIGAISGNGGEISGCYVTDFGIYAYLDDYYLYAGGISGKPASVTDSCV